MAPSTAPSLAVSRLRFTAIDLGTLGGRLSGGLAINDESDVVGQSLTPGDLSYAMFLRPREGAMVDLGNMPGMVNTVPNAVNRHRAIVGRADAGAEPDRAFMWSPDFGYEDLGTLGGDNAEAEDVNRNGWVVGYSEVQPGTFQMHAFLWRRGQGMVDLGTLGGSESYAWAINDRGQVVGRSSDAAGASRAFIWTQELGMQDLGLSQSEVVDINNEGVAIGYTTQGGSLRGFRWIEGRVELLPLVDGHGVRPRAIGDRGHVVGNVTIPGVGRGIALVYWRGAWSKLFAPEGLGNESVYAVNDCGRAVGSAFTPSGYGHAVLWTRPCR